MTVIKTVGSQVKIGNMKAELVKREDHWALYNEDGHKIAATITGCNSKLSIKNCQAIENDYDLDELAKKFAIKELADPNDYEHSIYASTIENTYMSAFLKALEVLGDKKYSEEALYDSLMLGIAYADLGIQGVNNYSELKELAVNRNTKTSWEVEILTEPVEQSGDNVWHNAKLDANGCLILKRI